MTFVVTCDYIDFFMQIHNVHSFTLIVHEDLLSSFLINIVNYNESTTMKIDHFYSKVPISKVKCQIISEKKCGVLNFPKMQRNSDVGLRRTCAYYRTSARAMCVRKCVRKGFGTVRAKVRACGQFSSCDLRSHFFYVLSHFVP